MVWLMVAVGLTGCIQVGGQSDGTTRLDTGKGLDSYGTWGTTGDAGQVEPWVSVEHFSSATCGITVSGGVDCLHAGLGGTELPEGSDFVQVELAGGWPAPMGCALRASGEAVCFAPEGASQLLVEGVPDVELTQLAGRDFLVEGQMCALDVDGYVHCWGDVQESPPEDEVFVDLDGGDGDFCGLRADGSVRCWEAFGSSYLEEPPEGAWEEVTVGAQYACVRAQEDVECWGRLPGDEAPDEPLTKVEAGEWSVCGIRADDSVGCWGGSGWGQNDVPDGAFQQVSPAEMTVAGLREDGSVEIWGGAFR
jgi:hypothetical protein